MSLNSETDPARRSPGLLQRPWTLAGQLTAWYAALSFGSVLLVTAVLYVGLSRNMDRKNNRDLTDRLNVFLTLFRDRPEDENEIYYEVEAAARQQSRFLVRIKDRGGRVLVEPAGMSEELPDTLFRGFLPADRQSPRARTLVGKSGRIYYGAVAETSLGQTSNERIVHVALDLTQEHILLSKYRTVAWTVLGTALIISVAGGHLIARHGLRRVERIRNVVREITSSTLDERVPTEGLPADLLDLVETLNGMLARLRDSFQRITRLSADVAHELRTPISTLRGQIEVSLGQARTVDQYRAVLESALDDCLQLSRTIDGVMFLARADHRMMPLDRGAIDLACELESIRDLYSGLAAEGGVRIESRVAGVLRLTADRILFHRALCNLVENALKHTPAGGTVTITARGDAGGVSIDVADTGSGIPPEERAQVFEPFYRVDRSRSARSGGAGLGLSIVRSILDLHGGRVGLVSEPGQGTCVSVWFPSAEESMPTAGPVA